MEFLTLGVMGMLLVAFDDGKLHWLEKEVLVDSMRASGDYFSAEEVLSLLDDSAHLLEGVRESEWRELFESNRDIPDKLKSIFLAMFIRMGFADGHLSPSERRLIHRIADYLDIDQQTREEVKSQALAAINTAVHERGVHYTGLENLHWNGD